MFEGGRDLNDLYQQWKGQIIPETCLYYLKLNNFTAWCKCEIDWLAVEDVSVSCEN